MPDPILHALTPIRFARLSRRLSQRQLAALAGLPYYVIRRADEGKSRIADHVSPEKLTLLASILRVPPSHLKEARLVVMTEGSLSLQMANAVHGATEAFDRIDEECEAAALDQGRFSGADEREAHLAILAGVRTIIEGALQEAEQRVLALRHRGPGQ